MNKHTEEAQHERFMAWKSDYIVGYDPGTKLFVRHGHPLGMEVAIK
ncbi:hypothetical protein FGG51_gp040 [Mycobacterium phage Astro]|uniref:Uncharacterized protein n=3 Tax=Fromanvirus TaxID=186764 RepID=G8IRE4_9CAUD|nr:hypothetical protein AVT31_gp041 [Mycobacterium phage Smeadley]YP_009638326.1 hypothetical protein FGG39_gp41 [Mycobacterium phage Saintus]YP_009638524.1 hypothetical protein FGG51_gp040 [Mycobacterium phage Astro]AXQ63571.1 hypothetical protein SEA_DIXON_65 [Mycobacterium phage Dixon]AYD86995.1 hypothetical protein SEA_NEARLYHEADLESS_66 [Mycobacterium phage NearlyHeadless]QBI96658.1 hypothetical protein SEA_EXPELLIARMUS_63 [Mycobacterium phage Expelliarmus]QHB36958.1 hypothetical protein 